MCHFKKKKKRLNERMQVGWISKGKVLQGKTAKVIPHYSAFIYSIYILCQTRCSTDVKWCILTADWKEPRYLGNQALSTVKEVKTYNRNISVSRNGLVSRLLWSRKEEERGQKDGAEKKLRTEAGEGGAEKVERGSYEREWIAEEQKLPL